ncbi:Gfo/Idh/MocA family protein [Saccharopolyspora griseoalba]|uniref:Gfo/Idh/MocA family protein n=1 Tax=Saccharopolyspora griseoalba TaxID=1431848 RepID=A0ABW2LHN9_9PSEU
MNYQQTRLAVVGYGYWGAKHARVLSSVPGVDLVVVDTDPERREEARRGCPTADLTGDFVGVLDFVDGVVVATPPTTHGDIAHRVLRAGKPVLVEKPLATSTSAARSLVETAAEHGARLMAGHTFEYNAAVWKLRETINSGELGRILYIDTARLNLGIYQNDVDVIWDLAPHDLSIIAFLMGERPASVATWAHRSVGARHADVAYLRLQLERSLVPAFVHVSWLDPQKVRRVTVVGDRKMAVYNDLLDEDRIRIYDIGVDPNDPGEPVDTPAMPVTYRTGDIVSPHVVFREPLLVQDTHFVDCVRTGERPLTPGESGLDVVRVLSASDVARMCGREVPVGDEPGVVDGREVRLARTKLGGTPT